MYRYVFARQKLWQAVHCLVGDGAIRDRLAFAKNYMAQLQPDKDLPEELQAPFRKLMADLQKRTMDYGYRPQRILTRAPKSGKMAETIFELYTKLHEGI